MSDLNIAVIGAGPVGGILGAHLIKAGNRVSLIDIWPEHMAMIRKAGLTIQGHRQFKVAVESTFRSVPAAALAGHRFDLVFVCVKATVVKHVAPDIPAVLADHGFAASFQNGLGSEAGLLKVLGPEKTLRGVVNYAGDGAGLGQLKMTFFNPPNYFGAAAANQPNAENGARQVAELMTAADLACEFSDNIQYHVWEKAIRNAALMPVSALTGQNMAQVMDCQRSLDLVDHMLRESIAIAKAEGHEFGPDFYDDTMEYYRRAGEHMPSMRADVLEGRQTEIEFLNHYIAETGERHGIPCCYNRVMSNLLLAVNRVTAERKK